jgi:DNA-directed RNA polymerase subunit M/transcription elongation factor TFIIS
MQTTKCPLCRSDLIIDEEAYEGDLVNCVNCRAEMEINSLHPLTVSVLESNEDDLGVADEDNNDGENQDTEGQEVQSEEE